MVDEARGSAQAKAGTTAMTGVRCILVLLLMSLGGDPRPVGAAEPAPGPDAVAAAPADPAAPAASPATDLQTPPAAGAETPAPASGGLPPIQTRWGVIVRIAESAEPVLWRDLDKLLLGRRFEPSEAEDDSTLMRREPAPGKVFVIVSSNLREDCSLGRHDLNLVNREEAYPCLAITRDRLPFDPRAWEYRYETGTAEIRLLFEVPAGLGTAALVTALPVTVPQPDIPICLTSPEPGGGPTPAAAPAPVETPAGAPDTAKPPEPAPAPGAQPPTPAPAGAEKPATPAAAAPGPAAAPAPAKPAARKVDDDWR